ncbi:MAG: response regulator [Dehalococcoidia bacterium]
MGEGRRTVLVVDDEEPVRRVLSSKLRREGYDCASAADGKEALDKVASEHFDVVLLDIKMPGMSGMQALPRIVAESPNTCVIMSTAVVDVQTALEALNLGACDFITKPFDLDDVAGRVDRALEAKGLMQQRQAR